MYMINKVLLTQPELFDIFQKDTQDALRNVEELNTSLQTIVSAWSKAYGLPENFCTVEITFLHDESKKGEFNYDKNKLFLEYELVVNKLGIPYYSNGYPWSNPLSNKETIETLAHEFRHAMQQYYRTHPEACSDKDFLQKIIMNTEQQQNPQINAYFTNKGGESSLLYHLQFVERDAFTFASEFCSKFNDFMQARYPDDPSFCMQDDFSNFPESVEAAKKAFRTETPYADMDDIHRKINNINTFAPLNKKMFKAVKISQKKTIVQQLQELTKTAKQKFPFDTSAPCSRTKNQTARDIDISLTNDKIDRESRQP